MDGTINIFEIIDNQFSKYGAKSHNTVFRRIYRFKSNNDKCLNKNL